MSDNENQDNHGYPMDETNDNDLTVSLLSAEHKQQQQQQQQQQHIPLSQSQQQSQSQSKSPQSAPLLSPQSSSQSSPILSSLLQELSFSSTSRPAPQSKLSSFHQNEDDNHNHNINDDDDVDDNDSNYFSSHSQSSNNTNNSSNHDNDNMNMNMSKRTSTNSSSSTDSHSHPNDDVHESNHRPPHSISEDNENAEKRVSFHFDEDNDDYDDYNHSKKDEDEEIASIGSEPFWDKIKTPLFHNNDDVDAAAVLTNDEEHYHPHQHDNDKEDDYNHTHIDNDLKWLNPFVFLSKYANTPHLYGRIIARKLSKHKWYNPCKQNGYIHPLQKYSSLCYLYQSNRAVTDIDIDIGTDDSNFYTHFDPPSLQKAWDYFEYVTLPRYIDYNPEEPSPPYKHKIKLALKQLFFINSEEDEHLDYAAPGTSQYATKLYSPLTTAQSQVGDFGLGIGLYLSVLRRSSLMMIIAAMLSIPNFMYFSSQQYSDGKPQLPFVMKGSAICTRMSLVPCPTCEDHEFAKARISDRFAMGTMEFNTTNTNSTNINMNLNFAIKNNCDGAKYITAFDNFFVLLFFIVFFHKLRVYQGNMEITLDHDEQTPRDYSIVISNPPGDADDPNEWKCFFESLSCDTQKIQVACCTIAVANDFLLRTLCERKEIFYRLESMLAPGTPLHDLDLARIAADIEANWSTFEYLTSKVLNTFGFFRWDVPSLYSRLIVLEAKIRGLAQRDYPVTRVFVTLETETMKNEVLKKLKVGQIQIQTNTVSNPNYRFRNVVLDVKEAEEPSTVRWTDLNATFFIWAKGIITSMGYFFVILGIAFFFVYYMDHHYPNLTPYMLSTFNLIATNCGRFITKYETHSFESGKQLSMFIKGSIFLFINTAVLIQYITPFASTITEGKNNLIYTVYRVMLYDAVFTIGLQIMDPIGHFKRHFLAPRAVNQEQMNSNFMGAYYDMADRYMNMWKILFMAIFYGSVFPYIYVLSGFVLFVFSFADRFSIMRTWYNAPQFGPSISDCSCVHVATLAVGALSVIGSYFWSGFPYDDLCVSNDTNDTIFGNYTFDPNVIAVKATDTSILMVDSNTTQYKLCSQNLAIFGFPALPVYQPKNAPWMTQEQQHVCSFWGWASVVIIILIVIRYSSLLVPKLKDLLFGGYEPTTEDQNISYTSYVNETEIIKNFTSRGSILEVEPKKEIFHINNAYIPQVRSPYFSFPLVACSDDDAMMCKDHMRKYINADRPRGYYNLVNDAKRLLNTPGLEIRKNVFSTFHHWVQSDDNKILEGLSSFERRQLYTGGMTVHNLNVEDHAADMSSSTG